ncbi:hypothetical protein [Methanocella sp. MCL-LM]|uniref:hypothetical protein n=1 Tax=Methanocella sp. MCL-LM TaxID=3412035 RepID=UPI003C78243A
MRNCYNHPGMGAVAACEACGRGICALCVTHVNDHVYCRDCAEEERKNLPEQPASAPAPEAAPQQPAPQPAPAPVDPVIRPPEEPPRKQPAPETPATPATPVAPATPAAPAEPAPPVAIVPAKPAQVAPKVVSPAPAPITPPPAGTAAKPAQKESLIAAILSLIVPGLGQVYNGHIKKGIVLAVIFYGMLVAILAGIVVLTISTALGAICCAPALLFPALVLLYAVYDAYESAEKINRGVETRDWL